MPNPFYQIYEGAALLKGSGAVLRSGHRRARVRACAGGGVARARNWCICAIPAIRLVHGDVGGVAGAVGGTSPRVRLRDRRRRVLFGDLPRRSCTAGGIADGGGAGGPGSRSLRRLQQPLQAFKPAGAALGLCGGRPGTDGALLRLSHLSRLRDASAYCRGECAGVERRRPMWWRTAPPIAPSSTRWHRCSARRFGLQIPPGGFYFWPETPGDDCAFTQALFEQENITVLPGSYLGREQDGVNPGAGRIRIALVAPLEECVEAAERLAAFTRALG